MFAINITYGHNDSQKALIFKTERDATKVDQAFSHPVAVTHNRITIQDDFGQRFSVRVDAITAWSLEDLDKTAEMQVEIAIHNQKVQARAQSAVMNDPQVRASMAMASMGRPGMGLQG